LKYFRIVEKILFCDINYLGVLLIKINYLGRRKEVKMENINMISLGFFVLTAICFTYFLIKGFSEEGWSFFALIWAIIFTSCGLLGHLPLLKEGVVNNICGLVFLVAVVDFFVVRENHQRCYLLGAVLVCCLWLASAFG